MDLGKIQNKALKIFITTSFHMHPFIDKYFAEYLEESQKRNPLIKAEQFTYVPPSGRELEELITYFCKSGIDFVIGGKLAVVKHLKLSSEDVKARSFRPISKVEIWVANVLPSPPQGWEISGESSTVWISPSRGCVEFYRVGDTEKLGKDLESIEADCPVLDIQTLFRMKLDLKRQEDLFDLLSLVSVVGLPVGLEEELVSNLQQKNLGLLKHWIQLKTKKKLDDENHG